jgi:hypothetical protein
MLIMKIVKAYARVAIEVLKGTSCTNVLTVILSLRVNVLLCRSPSKLKLMPTHCPSCVDLSLSPAMLVEKKAKACFTHVLSADSGST